MARLHFEVKICRNPVEDQFFNKSILTFGNGGSARAAPLLLRLVTHGDLPADVLVRLKDDDVHLRRVQTNERHRGAQADCHAERGDLGLVRVSGPKVNRHERQPDDAGGVHSEADELALVEVLRYFPRLHRVHRRDQDQQRVVQLREEETHVLYVALEDHLLPVWIGEPCPRWFDDHPY